jgi:hypothetical protein
MLRSVRFRSLLRLAVGAAAVLVLVGAAEASGKDVALRVGGFRVVERESGPVNYYQLFDKAAPPYIRGHYKPPYETAVLGYQLAEADRSKARRLRWRWRAVKLPSGGNECKSTKHDSAAVIYVTWRRTLRWYTLKYVWSASAPKGSVCDRKRNPFVAQDTVVLRSGGPLDTWQGEDIDLRAEFRKHFEDGNPEAEVPDLLGIGLMTDGDQTQSESAADYAGFVLSH